jgi:predicted nucleotidyltransferase
MRVARSASVAVMELAARLAPVFAARAEIAAVYVFGSVARGEARPESDVDLGLVFGRRSRVDGLPGDLLAELAYEIGKRTDQRHVDLVVLEPQGPIFCHRVLCEGRLIYEGDRDRRVDFESETMVRAFDFRPTWELATRGKELALRRWLKSRYDLR